MNSYFLVTDQEIQLGMMDENDDANKKAIAIFREIHNTISLKNSNLLKVFIEEDIRQQELLKTVKSQIEEKLSQNNRLYFKVKL